MVTLFAASLSLSGCATAGAGQSTPRAPAAPSEEATPLPHLRQVGPDNHGRELVLRFGDQLKVSPGRRPDGWVVTEYNSSILRLQSRPDAAADSHTFLAIAVGEGQLVLTPAGPQAGPADAFIQRIRVLRDTVQPPPP
jgi:hypothetical protein